MAEEFDYPEPDDLDQRWFVADSEHWAEVVRLLERAPEPKPKLAALLRERGLFPSSDEADGLVDELRKAGEEARNRPKWTKRQMPTLRKRGDA